MARDIEVEITSDILDKKDFIRRLAKRTGYFASDVTVIINEMVKMFEEATAKDCEIRIRGFGRLYHQHLPARVGGLSGKMLPPATRTAFRLADNIRTGGMIFEEVTDEESDESLYLQEDEQI